MSDTPVRRVAAELRRRGLTVPARLLADAHRPLAPLLSDLGMAVGPVIGAITGGRPERLLGDPDALDSLVAALDAAEERA